MSAPADARGGVMRQYSVGRDDSGRWCWWESWTCMAHAHTDVRAATQAEAEIMERFLWANDRTGDGEALRALMARGGA